MKRPWLAVACLAASWLAGLGYYHQPDALHFAVLIALGVALLIGTNFGVRFTREIQLGAESRIYATVTLFLLLISIYLIPWPYCAIAVLMAAGLILILSPIPARWPAVLGRALVAAGSILLAQVIVFFVYMQLTARSHDLPGFIGGFLAMLARVAGINAGFDGHNIQLATSRGNLPLGATWELLIDPVTLAFCIGGCAWLGWRNWRRMAWIVGGVIVWLPFRAALMMGLLAHNALQPDDAATSITTPLWNTCVHLLLLAGPVALIWRFAAETLELPTPPAPRSRRAWFATGLAFAGAIIITCGLYYQPAGVRQKGRILIDELHSHRLRTDKPFDTEWYGAESGYNYAVLYDYCSHFYDVSRLNAMIDDESLARCDVLVLKVPTQSYGASEVAAVKRFVGRGGGLLLLADRADVEQSSTYLNAVARSFGFAFRPDSLFDIDGVFAQKYTPALLAHPAVQNVSDLDFEVSSSIDPGISRGSAAILSTGLRSLPADYHAENFYPRPTDRADARYGAFVQLWTARDGAGRVAGFTNASQFTNSSLFDPSKSELFLGMLEWLNHRDNSRRDVWLMICGAGLVALIAASALSHFSASATILSATAALLGWSATVVVCDSIHRKGYPPPTPRTPLVTVVMDRTICDSPLPLGGIISGQPDGFGLFERWMLRLGYITARRDGDAALSGNVLVFAYPRLAVPRDFRDRVVNWVNSGGKIVVLDSAANQHSTADSLLFPFGIKLNRATPLAADVEVSPGSTVPIADAITVTGGEALLKINDLPVIATLTWGKGSVTVIGCGSRFTDLNMGFTGNLEPDPILRRVYQTEYDVMKKIVGK